MTAAGTRVSGLICTLPRSGSWLLSEYLDNTGLAGTPEEYFRPDYLDGYLARWGMADPVPIEEYVRACLRETTTARTGVFTAKTHWYQMDWLCRELRSPASPARLGAVFGDVRYVRLIRQDRLRQALSWHRAIRSNAWFDVGDGGLRFDGAPDLQQVRWLEDTLDDHNRRWDGFFAAAGVEPYTVSFTDVVEHPAETVRSILAHLDVDCPADFAPPAGRLVKQSDGWTDFWERAYRQVRDALPRRDAGIHWSPQHNRFVRVAALR